jgi:multidrug efflux pump subunit AcrA (membrane-fusion protein)
VHRASVLLPLLAAVLVAGCSGDGDPRVQTAIVGRATVTEAVDAPGTVSARATAALAAPADATVAEVLVADGATVAKDAVLVRLSSPAAAERLRTARQQLDSAASVHVPVPRADLRPLQESLDAAAHATQSEADAGAEGLEQALAAVTRSQRTSAAAAVSAAQATVDALTVRAPIAGVVTLGAGEPPAGGADDLSGLVDGLPEALQGQAEAALGGGGGGQGATTTTAGLSVGAAVSSGAPLLTVTDLSGLTVTAEVDETDVLLVAVGTPATVEVDAVPGAEYPAAAQGEDLVEVAGVEPGARVVVRDADRLRDGQAVRT